MRITALSAAAADEVYRTQFPSPYSKIAITPQCIFAERYCHPFHGELTIIFIVISFNTFYFHFKLRAIIFQLPHV